MKRSLVLLLLASVPLAAAEKAPKATRPPASDPVAMIGSEPFTAAELEELNTGQLFALRTQQYNLQRQLLEEAIGKRLLAKEAEARKVSADDLLRLEVDGKIAPVKTEDVNSFYEQNRPRFGNIPEAEARQRTEEFLRSKNVETRKAEFLASLRERAKVKILLEPPRVKVEAADGPARGPEKAPVTLIIFSDFQCPYCARVQPTLERIERTYGDRLRTVFRDYPLPNHAQAPKAAEAGACAAEQGKFWPFHDRLFANQQTLSVPDLEKHAEAVGLDTAAFAACLASGKYEARWKKGLDDGNRTGLTGTPAFFVNGRMLIGAAAYEQFSQIIEDELARAGVRGGPMAPPVGVIETQPVPQSAEKPGPGSAGPPPLVYPGGPAAPPAPPAAKPAAPPPPPPGGSDVPVPVPSPSPEVR